MLPNRVDTDGVRRPPFQWGSVHPTSVLELTKNEVDESSMSYQGVIMTSLTIPGVELLNQLPVDFFNRMSSNLPDAAAATVAFASRHPPPPHGATLKSMLLCPLHRKTAPKRTLFKVTAGSSTPFLLLPVKINVWAAGPPFIWTVTFQRPSLPVRACLKAMTSSGWKHSPYQHLKW